MNFLYKQKEIFSNKEIRSSLVNSIYGLGIHKSNLIASKLGCSYPFNLANLNIYFSFFLTVLLDAYSWLEIRIKRNLKLNIDKFINGETLRGFNHQFFLPCNGQRTRTNGRTNKNKRSIEVKLMIKKMRKNR